MSQPIPADSPDRSSLTPPESPDVASVPDGPSLDADLGAPPESTIASPWSNRRALAALLPLWLVLAAIAVAAPWHSNRDIDGFSHFWQVRSVADHGSVGFDNGPSHLHDELRPRWLFPAHGRTWGPYPAVLAYILAPAMKLAGFQGAVRFMWWLFLIGTAITYALTYRLTRRPFIAVASAYVVGIGSSLPIWGTFISPFLPVASLGVFALYAASRVYEQETPRRKLAYAAIAGLFSSAAVGCHLLWTIAWALIGAVFLLHEGRGEGRKHAIAYGLGSVPAFALMSLVNHVRFGAWNPISYGPCDQDTCIDRTNVLTAQSPAYFTFSLLVFLPFILIFVASLWTVRKSRPHFVFIAMLAPCVILIPEGNIRRWLGSFLLTAWGYIFDVGSLDMGYPAVSHNIGRYNPIWSLPPYCVRSLLQCTPVLIVASIAARPPDGNDPATVHARQAWNFLVACITGVFVVCLMRANMPGAHPFGNPEFNLRYTTPALPALAVLAFLATRNLPWRWWHALIAFVVAAAIGTKLAPGDDTPLVRRVLTLWGPLVTGFLFWFCAAYVRWQSGRARVWFARAGAVFGALCIGYGGAVVYGIDRVITQKLRGAQDSRVDELARCAPERRFILLGGVAMDEASALADRREIYMINPGMGPPDGRNARVLLDAVLRPDRPAYLIEDDATGPWHFDWPGLAFTAIPGCPRVLRITRR